MLAEKEILKTNDYLVLRTNFFGYNKIKKGLVNWFLKSCKLKEKIFLYENIYFSPLYALDLAKIIFKILDKNISGIYNVGSKNHISKANFLMYLNKHLDLKGNFKIIKYDNRHNKVKRPLNMKMNSKKFEKKFEIKLPKIKNQINKMIKNEF